MILLTIGTLFEFDRLVKAVDEILDRKLIQDEIFAQIGPGTYKPKYMEWVKHLSKVDFEKKVQACEAIISHAGMGSIATALSYQKPLLAVPRLKKYGEHVNDHQSDSARKYEELGHILAVYDTDELPEKIQLLKTFVPKPRTPNVQGVVDRIDRFLRTGS